MPPVKDEITAVEITKMCMVGGQAKAAGTVLAVPDDVSASDAGYLVAMQKAKVSDKKKK